MNSLYFSLFRPCCEKCLLQIGRKSVDRYTTTKLVPYGRDALSNTSILQLRFFSTIRQIPRSPSAYININRFFVFSLPSRNMSAFRALGAVGRFLKIRYLVFASAVGGGYTVHQVI